MKAPLSKQWLTRLNGAEFKVWKLQEGPSPEDRKVADNPETVVEYLLSQIGTSVAYRPDCENLMVIYLSARLRPIGWQVVSNGTLDTLLVSAASVFKGAIVTGAYAIILAHNHPSGDPSPSESDIKVTREMMMAGQLLKINLMDHIILGHATSERPKAWVSLRELGYFYDL